MQNRKEKFPLMKGPMRQITNNSKSKLATRLYRNSSLNRINPNISLLSSSSYELQPYSLNNSSINQNNQLVASISLKKLGKKFEKDSYLQISQGKVLVNRSKFQPNQAGFKDETHHKRMFKKLDKLNYSPSNRILPDDLIDFPIEKQQINNIKLTKKSNLSPPRNKNNKFNSLDDKEDLYPEDFIQLLCEDKNIKNEFCYLKKMDHPYDLKIIEFDKNLQKNEKNNKNQYSDEYITISSRGVTYFSEQQPRFVPLQQWLREANYFKKIIKLDFFKHFKVIKNFSNWKKFIRKSAMKSTIEKLKQKLVVNDQFLRKSLLEIRETCNKMEVDVSYCSLDGSNSKAISFRQFKGAQQMFIQNQFERRIAEAQETIKGSLIRHMAQSMKEFKEENKISSSIEGKGMPLLIGDEKNLQMPYTKQATLRTQQQKFQKFVKLIDLMIAHSKINMMSESTIKLVKNINDQNENYERQVVGSNYKNTFKGKQYLECTLSLDTYEPTLFLRPTLDDMSSLFEDIVNRSVVRLCRNHRKITSDIDVLSVIYDNQDQFPKQSQSQNLKAIMTSDSRQQQMLRMIMMAISCSYNHMVGYIRRFETMALIHSQNLAKLEELENLKSKDHQLIRNLIEKWYKEKQLISQINKEHQGPLFQLNLKQFKDRVEKTTNACIIKIKQVLPKIFQNAIDNLKVSLAEAKSQMIPQSNEQRIKFMNIQSLMVFNQNMYRIRSQMEAYFDQMSQITGLQNLVRNMFSSNSQSNHYKKYEKDIQQLRLALPTLDKILNKAQSDNNTFKQAAFKQVNSIRQKNSENLSSLYKQIEIISKQTKTLPQMMKFISKIKADLLKVQQSFQKIKVYEQFLNLDQSDLSILINFTQYFQVYQKIWLTANQYQNQLNDIQNKSWGLLKTNETNSRLEQLISCLLNLEKQINSVHQKDSQFQFSAKDHLIVRQTIQNFEQIRPLFQVIECLNDKAIGQKQWKQIKSTLQIRNPKLFQALQKDKTQVKLIQLVNQNVIAQLILFKGISSKAKKNSQIVQKMQTVKIFSNFSKQHLNLFRNLIDNFKSEIGTFMKQLDQKIIMTNFIIEQIEVNDREKAKNDRNTLEKLKQILVLWNNYEEHFEYFQPIYNYTDWKNTPEGKLFINATQQNWKKTCKNFKDSNLSKILAAERIIPSLKESNQILESLYPSINIFFNSKRVQCNRIYFLSDDQIVKIHSQNKDFRGFNKYISKIFPSIKQLTIKEDEAIPCEAVNFDGQRMAIKLGRISNFEMEEMVRVVQDGLKNGVKYNCKNCYLAFDSQEFNRIAWIKQYPLQVLLFVTGVYFVKIIEQDYLCSEGREDFKKLFTYHVTQMNQLRKAIDSDKEIDNLTYKKSFVLLTQAIAIRDTILHLMQSGYGSKESYDWLKQVRHYYNNMEHAYVQYLNVPITYGNEFVCLTSNPLIATTLNEKQIIKMVNNLFCCNNVPIVDKSFLQQLSLYNAKPYVRTCVSSSENFSLLENIIAGTWLTGSFSDLVLPPCINLQQLKIIAMNLQQVQLAAALREPFLRGFKSMPVYKQSGMVIICPTLMHSPLLSKCNFEYRVIRHQQVSWKPYISLLFEIHDIKMPNLPAKTAKLIEYLEQTLHQTSISRSQFYSWLQQIKQNIQSQTSFAKLFLKRINRKDLKLCTKKFLSKIFNSVYGITVLDQLTTCKSIRDFSQSQQQISKITSILKDKQVCIVSGKSSKYKDFVIHMVCKQFNIPNYQIQYTLVTDQNLFNLLGQYQNGKWVSGYLSQQINSSSENLKLIVLQGKCTPTILDFLQKLTIQNHNKNNYVNMQNSQKLILAMGKKLLFVTETERQNEIFQKYHLGVHDISSSKFTSSEMLKYLSKQLRLGFSKSIFEKKHFQKNLQSFNSLCNIYLNNYQKISLSNLKTLGYKNQYMESQLIMSRFITIINAALQKDTEKACLINPKMLQKTYLWALFWSVFSNVPQRCIERLEKIFDMIKIEIDKTQSLSETRFAIQQRNQSIFKFVKLQKVFQNSMGYQFVITPKLQAKKQFIKLLANENNHVLLTGNRNSGKSNFMQYLQNQFKCDGYSVLETKLTCKTTLSTFLQWLKSKTYIQFFPTDSFEKYKLCSNNGKKLILFIDNFNMIDTHSQLYQFFYTFTSFGFYFDRSKNCKVKVGDIFLVCANNGALEPITKNWFCLDKLLPVWVQQSQLSEIVKAYETCLEFIPKQESREMLQKIFSSVAPMHEYSTNLFRSGSYEIQKLISYRTPVWIMKQLLDKAGNCGYCGKQLIQAWKYLTIMKYTESGISSSHQRMIKNELENMISLIAKNSQIGESFLLREKQWINEIVKTNPLLQLGYQNQKYYTNVAYLLSSSQLKHVIGITPQTCLSIKMETLTQVCKKVGFQCANLTCLSQLQQFKYKNNIVVYVDWTNPQLLHAALATLISESLNPYLTFVIDFQTPQQLQQYIIAYPSVFGIAHVSLLPFNKNNCNNSIQHYNIIHQFLQQCKIQPNHSSYFDIFWRLSKKIRQVKLMLATLIQKRNNQLKMVVNNFQLLSKCIDDGNQQIAEISLQIQTLSKEEEAKINAKNQLLQSLMKIKKSNSQSSSHEKELINKSLASIDAQLKKIKNAKNEKNEHYVKVKQNFKQKLETYTFLRNQQKKYLQQSELLEALTFNSSLKSDSNSVQQRKRIGLLIIHSILQLHYQNSCEFVVIEIYKYVRDQFCQSLLNCTLSSLYSSMLGLDILDMEEDECIIRWVLMGYETQFVTKHPDNLIQRLLSKCPQLQVCTTPFEYSQCQQNKPILCKDMSNWGESKVSVIAQTLPKNVTKVIKYDTNFTENNGVNLAALYEALQTQNGQQISVLQRNSLKKQKQKLQNQLNLLSHRLKQKIESQKSQFISVNFGAEIKQLNQVMLAIKSRIDSAQQKIDAHSNELRSKYGTIIEKYIKYAKYFDIIRNWYPYAQFAKSHYLNLIVKSIVFKEVASDEQQQEKKLLVSIDQTVANINAKMCQWVFVVLAPNHIANAIFLLACFYIYQNGWIEEQQINLIVLTLTELQIKNVSEVYFECNSQTSKQRFNHRKLLVQVFQKLISMKTNNKSIMIQFAEQILKISYKNQLAFKDNWINGIESATKQNIFSNESNLSRKVIMLRGSSKSNLFKLIDKEIKQCFGAEQNILYFSESSLQHTLEIVQKSSQSQLWIVLAFWKKIQNINKIISFIQGKNIIAAFLFQGQQQFQNLKNQINYSQFFEVSLYDKTKSPCYQSLKIISKHQLQKSTPQMNRLLKMMAFDQIFKMCKGFQDPVYRPTAYSYRILQCLMKKNPKIKATDLIFFALDFYYQSDESSSKAFLREAKKLFKDINLPSNPDDSSLPQIYNHISETYQQIKPLLEREENLKKFLTQIFPPQYINKLSEQTLYGYDNQRIANLKEQDMNEQFLQLNRQKIIDRLNEIIKKAPIATKMQQLEKIVFVHHDMLIKERKSLYNQHVDYINLVKRLKKIVQSDAPIPLSIKFDLVKIQNQRLETILASLLENDVKMQSLQKLIQSKEQVNAQVCMQLLKKPRQFLYAFMLECCLSQKFDWTQLQISMKCISQKQKDLLKQQIEKNENLLFYNLKIVNAKFDGHKNILESIEKGETSKLPIVMIYFDNQESQSSIRKLPFIINKQQIGQISMISKAKCAAFLSCPIEITFQSKQN